LNGGRTDTTNGKPMAAINMDNGSNSTLNVLKNPNQEAIAEF